MVGLSRYFLILISAVLDFERLIKTVIVNERFDFLKFLSEIKERKRSLFSTKSIECDFSISPNLPRYIISDRTRLSQLLINIGSNSFKSTPKNGRVSFSVDAQPHPFPNTRLITFQVEDTGIGIPQSDLKDIFKPYSQASHQHEYTGSGLGLAIVKQIVDQFGGEIQVSSTVGVGTTFKVDLPVQIPDEDHIAIDIPSSRHSTLTEILSPTSIEAETSRDPLLPLKLEDSSPPKRILIVDDAPINRTILSKMITRLYKDAVIQEATDGLDAVATFEQGEFDIIFMDIVMPGLDGYEATKRIRDKDPDIPVILCTANFVKSEDVADLHQQLNILRVLTKPFTIRDLKETFRDSLKM